MRFEEESGLPAECRELLDTWMKACWSSGVHPRKDSDNPLEVLAYRTGEAIKKLNAAFGVSM